MENENYKPLLRLFIDSLLSTDQSQQPPNHQLILTVGQTPDLLIQLGFDQLPLVFTGKVIDKSFFDHGVTQPILERTYSIVANPKAIYNSDNDDAPDGTVLISFETNASNHPLLIAIHPKKQLGRSTELYNHIASMYFKQGDAEKRWKSKNLLKWEAQK